jgi:hypothetical protein
LVSRETEKPRLPLTYAEGDERRERGFWETKAKAVVDDLEEIENRRGERAAVWLNPKPYATLPRAEESLEVEAFRAWHPAADGPRKRSVEQRPVRALDDNGREETALDEGARLRGERSP